LDTSAEQSSSHGLAHLITLTDRNEATGLAAEGSDPASESEVDRGHVVVAVTGPAGRLQGGTDAVYQWGSTALMPQPRP
jgi:hypothetical protein